MQRSDPKKREAPTRHKIMNSVSVSRPAFFFAPLKPLSSNSHPPKIFPDPSRPAKPDTGGPSILLASRLETIWAPKGSSGPIIS